MGAWANSFRGGPWRIPLQKVVREHLIKVISNLGAMASAVPADEPVRHEYIGNTGLPQFIRACLSADLVILNVDQKRLMMACLLRWLWPFSRFKLISVDLILRPPKSTKGKLIAFVKRLLFSRVHRFMLYFKDLRGYEKFYGIGSDRVVYIPFKVNGWEQIAVKSYDASSEDYVLCAGRTLRDIETFVRAMERAGCPGVLLQQKSEFLKAHGSSAWSGELPPNLKLSVDEGDSLESFCEFIRKARMVVIPRFRGDIAATGISTYLVAMALQKCVVISGGPGAEDVLSDQAVIVPPEDVNKLAEQIRLLWGDRQLRSEVASRGRKYAETLGGERRLLSDILRASIRYLHQTRPEVAGSNANHKN